ncbi:translation elongation factor Ts [Myxococcota bacterium]|nr:translation elongation factor Ts [Myxococcota bacterium]
MEISAQMVKDLRERTGAGILDCRKALTESGGNFENAIDWLRTKGLAAAAKKAGRAATEGLIGSYIHGEGRIGVLVEVNCETDFVARTPQFREFCRDVAMQIAASAPTHVRREEVPADVIEKERGIYRAQAIEEGKPEKIVDRIVDGRVEKMYAETCLLEQKYIKDPDITVGDLVTRTVAALGENISVRRFSRFVLGEGLEKKSSDFAAEVAAAARQAGA